MDLYTTLVKLAGQEPPSDRIVDGIDLAPTLFQQKNIDRYKISDEWSCFCCKTYTIIHVF